MNIKDGDSQFIEIALKNIHIFEHSDKDVDIALFVCLPDQNICDFKVIPHTLIANKATMEENKIAEGDEVLFAVYSLLILVKKGISPS
ncbi:MAG: hypothetical protein HQK55_12845 [Deltaproteobacteria bacterium]|nr:hypothetical protein [Deltaproteobacteria bacterium]